MTQKTELKVNTVSVIIPALNEENTIANVLRITVKHPLVSEVIVIDDASVDGTSQIAREYGAKLMVNQKRLGKTQSCKNAVEISVGSIILFLDADLLDITEENVTDLLTPIINDKADLTMSLRGNAILRPLGIDFFTGERAMKRKIAEDPLLWSNSKSIYSLEILMNKCLLDNNYRFRVVDTPNIKIVYKFNKLGFFKSIGNEIRIWGYDIPKSIGYFATIKQCFKMSFLKNKYNKL